MNRRERTFRPAASRRPISESKWVGSTTTPLPMSAGHTLTHDARGDELQGRLLAVDHQGVTGVVTTLEADHSGRVVGQPVRQLCLCLRHPIGCRRQQRCGQMRCRGEPTRKCFAWRNPVSQKIDRARFRARAPTSVHRRARVRDRNQFLDVVFMSGQHTHHSVALPSQFADSLPQSRITAPGGADGRVGGLLLVAGQQVNEDLQIQAETGGRTTPAEHGTDFVVTPTAHQRVGVACAVHREANAAVVGVATEIGKGQSRC